MSDLEQRSEDVVDATTEPQGLPPESGDSNQEEDQGGNPMPFAVKLLMLGLVIFVLIAVTVTVKFLGKKPNKPAAAATSQQIQTPASKNEDNPEGSTSGVDYLINNPNPAPQIKIENDPADNHSNIDRKIYAEEIASNVANNVRQEFSSTLEAQDEEILSLKKQLQQINGSVAAIKSSAANADSSALTRISALNESINLLSEQMTSLEKRVHQISSISDVKTAAAVKRIHNLEEKFKADPAAPPFELLSVDEWGTEKQAVLELDGHTTVAAKGEIRAGWQIVSLSNTEIECQRLKDGRLYVLKRKGGA